jgi:hypothetical protein
MKKSEECFIGNCIYPAKLFIKNLFAKGSIGNAIGTKRSIITAIAVARKFGSAVQVISIVITPHKLIRFTLIVFHEELSVVKPSDKMLLI